MTYSKSKCWVCLNAQYTYEQWLTYVADKYCGWCIFRPIPIRTVIKEDGDEGKDD